MLRLLLMVLYSGCSMYMGYTTLAPFFPGEIMSRGLNPLYNSAIFAIYALSYILLANIAASLCIPKFGRVKTFVFGGAMMAASIYFYGIIYFISNNSVFIILTLIIRLVQGCGAALILITGFAMIAAAYPNKTGIVTSLNQIGIRLGLTLGPLLGSFIYRVWGFIGPFYTVGTLSIPPILLTCLVDTKNIADGKVALKTGVNSKIRSCNRRAVFAYLGFCLSMMKLAVLETTLSDKLMFDFKFTPDQVALYLFAYTGSSTLICFFMPLVPESIDKRFFMVPANLLCGFSAFLIGPSPTLKIANTSQTVLIGLLIGGSLGAVVPCFVVAEAITATKRFIQPEQYQIMLNKVSGYRTFFHGFGILVGPILGGVIMYYLGFPRLMEVLGLILVVVGIMDIMFIIYEHFEGKKQAKEQPEVETNIRNPDETTLLLQEEDLHEEQKFKLKQTPEHFGNISSAEEY